MIQNQLVFHSERNFVVYSYDASHGLLLLRSRKTKGATTRIDVLFQDVRAMEVRSWFVGIRIEESDQQQLEGCKSNPLEMIEPGNRIYSIIGNGWQGFVVGGIVSILEDDGEYSDPSGLLSPRAR
ncbi:MAG TPA: hypothetical protein VN025_15045 [Candidatus Dormibacteraeota bacterium]|jgi:hypothetical protein|nr:hypothetical protein [Candidatus Dormibacteraeota bacterium]